MRRTLDAALSELARVGYVAFRIEDVAKRAKVNKTTVYRRWPTKEVLVRAALLSKAERSGGLVVPDTGSLEGDLAAIIRRHLRFARSAEGRAIIRVLTEAAGDDDLLAITKTLRSSGELVVRTVLERARARGALRREADIAVVMDLIQLACDRARSDADRVGPRFVNGLVDVLLNGAACPRIKSNTQLRSKR